uniref:Uncharacterized protein n=1 Tax=Haptolina brevifila TaxID=156173 RepID=A0A7S2JKL1_9EUKA|mmetsp:Transcript_83745/g.167222  ORF Transcript_83745/g.167222 Transcript_83745/m.167222 type:complete len:165 (+) Transcript_83745:120-614(+)
MVVTTEAQREIVRDELTVANLNYRHTATKIIGKSWRFFTCVVYLQCLAAFSRSTVAPSDVGDAMSGLQVVPTRHAWLYSPFNVSIAIDPELALALNRSETARACGAMSGWGGWTRSEAWLALIGSQGDSAVAVERLVETSARAKERREAIGLPSHEKREPREPR